MVLVTKIVINYYGKVYNDYLVSKNKSIFGIFTNSYKASEVVNNEHRLDNDNKRLKLSNVHFDVFERDGGSIEWTTKNECLECETKKIFIIDKIDDEVADKIYEFFENKRREKD